MTQFYKKEQLDAIKVQKKRSMTIYLVILGVFILISLLNCIWFTTLPYKSSTIHAIRWIQNAISASFIIFSFLYLGIKYARENRYYKVLIHLETGQRETSVGSFFEYNENLSIKDGVDVKSMIFLEWNARKQDFFERKVLVLSEMDFPVFEENQNVRYVTQGNILVEYEILPEDEETK